MSKRLTLNELKQEARALRVQYETEGKSVIHCQALELVAAKHGFDSWHACFAILSGRSMVGLPPDKAVAQGVIDTAEEFSVRRNGDGPVRFLGRIVGTAEEKNVRNNNWYQRTTIYQTRAGKYVAEVFTDAIFLEIADRKVAVCDAAADVVDWLRDDEGKLSVTAARALVLTAVVDAAIAAAYGEVVP